jgi:hypothetical protein
MQAAQELRIEGALNCQPPINAMIQLKLVACEQLLTNMGLPITDHRQIDTRRAAC